MTRMLTGLTDTPCLNDHPREHMLYTHISLSLLWPTSLLFLLLLLLQHLSLFKWEQRSSFLSSVPPSQGSLPSPALFLRRALHDGKPVAPYTLHHPHSLTVPFICFVAVTCSWRWARMQLRWTPEENRTHTHTHTKKPLCAFPSITHSPE